MSEEEWRLVSLGIQRNYEARLPQIWAEIDARTAAIWKLPEAERLRQCEAERQEMNRRSRDDPGPKYWELLWATPDGDNVLLPRDIVRRQEELIAVVAKAGCRCVRERRLVCLREDRFGRLQAAE